MDKEERERNDAHNDRLRAQQQEYDRDEEERKKDDRRSNNSGYGSY